MRFLVPLLLACVVLVAAGPARYTGTLYLTKRDGTPTFTAGVIDKDKGTAWATFDDGEYALSDGGNGWGVLYLNLNPKHLADNDNTAMYAAGYLEGAMTWQQIWDNYKNYYFGWFSDKSVPKKAKEFFDKNLKYARDQISKKKEDSYWSEVDLLMNQFDGLLDGYNSVADSDKKLTAMDFLMINGNGDMDDILDALGVSVTEATRKRIHRNRETLPGGDPLPGFFNDHCSASIRVLPGNADLFFSHDTWSSYDQMTRIFKHYDFPLTRAATEVDATRRISFSSSPGFIASTDDWYLTNKGLAVFETTTEFYNQSMYNQIGPENCLLSFWRSMLANYNAKTGPEWIHWFEQQNSGTYNNQWMIVNLNLFTPGMAALPDDLLWITEQLPGFCTSGDMTDFLRKDGYWASYNIPYFPYVYDISGFKAMYDKHGDEYSWSKCARAKIFARDAPKVTDYAGFQKMMNSNDYKNDPLSDGYPDRAIMARGDLAKSFPVPSGGIDSKASSYSRALKLECDAINGPTHQSLPVYDWNAFNSVPHLGQPQQFNFDWVAMTPTGAQSTVHASFPHAMPALASSAVPRTQPSVAASVAEAVLPVVENVLAVM